MEGQLVLVCPYDPAARFVVGHAMQRNKLIYALSDAALVVNSDHGHGGTWAGATDQLDKLRFVPVYVRASGRRSKGIEGLLDRGARSWPNPRTPEELERVLRGDPLEHQSSKPGPPTESGQYDLSLAESSEVREDRPDQPTKAQREDGPAMDRMTVRQPLPSSTYRRWPRLRPSPHLEKNCCWPSRAT